MLGVKQFLVRMIDEGKQIVSLVFGNATTVVIR